MSDIFSLDPRGQREVALDAQANGIPLEALEPTFFQGSGLGTGLGVMRGGARVGQFLSMAAVAPVALYESATDQEGRFTDPYFKTVDEYFNDAVGYWTPAAAEVGKAGQVLGGLGEIALPLMAGVGNPTLLIGAQEFGVASDLAREGVDAETAVAAGVVQGLATAVGFKLPFLGKTLGRKMLAGAGGNLITNTAAAATIREGLVAGGYEDHAAAFNPLDPAARMVDVLTGVAFGAVAHGVSPKVPRLMPSQVRAIATANNAKHFQQDTAPGIPADASSYAAHSAAMEQSIAALIAGDEVAPPPAIARAAFIPRETAPPPEVPPELKALDEAREEQGAVVIEATPPAQPGVRAKTKMKGGKRPPSDPSNMDVLEFLSTHKIGKWYGVDVVEGAAQGLDPADMKAALGVGWFRPFVKGGASFDAVAEALDEAGYPVKEMIDGEMKATPNKVLEVLDRAIRGEKIYAGEAGWNRLAEEREAALAEYRPEPEDLTPYEADTGPADAQNVALVARANEIDTAAVERLAIEHTDDAAFYAAIKELVDAHEGTGARGGGEGERPPAAPKAGGDLFGDDTSAKQGLADETRRRDLIRSPNKDVSLETGDPTDLVSAARDQIDFVVETAKRAVMADPDLEVPTGVRGPDGEYETAAAADVLVKSEMEIEQAELDAKGFEAAVECFLQNGGGNA